MESQNTKIAKLESENEVFRKFYSRNQADARLEHTAEIEHVFHDFGKAIKTKDNFINRGMKELSGIVNDHLKVENRFTYRKKRNLTDSGSEIGSQDGDQGYQAAADET